MEIEAIQQLRDLRDMIDQSISHLETNPRMVQDDNNELMAYDILIGGRFGIIDLQKGRITDERFNRKCNVRAERVGVH